MRKRRRTSTRWKQVTSSRIRSPGRQKRRSSTRKRIGSLLWVIFLAALCLGGEWLHGLAKGPGQLPVKEVRVEAYGDIPLDEILSRVRGIKGKNILSINPRKLARILGEQPGVARVTVKKNLIQRIVSIQIFPREPVALVSGRTLLGLDGEGVVIPLSHSPQDNLAVVSGIPASSLVVGKKEETGRARVALEVIEAFG